MESNRFSALKLVHVWRIAAVLFVTAAVSSCSNCGSDPDGIREGANVLALKRQWSDSLSCGPDCADWYRTQVASSGTFAVDIDSTASAKSPPSFSVELWSQDGRRLDSKLGTPGGAVQVRAPVSAGWVYTAVKVSKGDLGYSVRARLLTARAPSPPSPPPSPPRVRYKDVTASVIELEGHGEGRKVLIDKGTDAGLRSGQRGRLVDGGRTLAEIEIVEVFAEGSRARLLGKIGGVVSGSTRAVIQVPVR